jgi:hypothetical protein
MMKLGHILGIAVVMATIAAPEVPALAESSGSPDNSQPGVPSMRHGGHGKMSGGMMVDGCAGMMQSMKNGGGRPNEQWGDRTPDNDMMPR